MSEQTPAANPSPIVELTAKIDALVKAPEIDRNELDSLLEKRAFAKWWETQPQGAIPNVTNFEDAFKSYKNLQGFATKVSQENANLRKQVETTAPAQQPSETPVAKPEASTPAIPTGMPQITPPAEQPAKEATPETKNPFLSKTEYDEIRNEAINTGNLSPERRAALVARGVDETVIDDMVEAGKARAAIAWQRLIRIAGSQDRAVEVFAYAATLPAERIATLNEGLKGPNHEMIFRGLSAEYDQVMAAKPKEPAKIKNQSAVSATTGGQVLPYRNLDEYRKDRNDARFNSDPAFRNAVFARASASPFLNGEMFARQ
jgi:hypothetical protein